MFVGATAFSFVVGNMAALISKLSGQAGAFREKMDTATVRPLPRTLIREEKIPLSAKCLFLVQNLATIIATQVLVRPFCQVICVGRRACGPATRERQDLLVEFGGWGQMTSPNLLGPS